MDAEELTVGSRVAVVAGTYHDSIGTIAVEEVPGIGGCEVDLGYGFMVTVRYQDLRPLDALAVGDGAKLL